MATGRLSIAAELLDEQVEFTLQEVIRLCDASAAEVVDLVAEGVVAPCAGQPGEWRFTGTSVVRIQTALRLEADLGLNRAGAALVLELLEHMEELRRRLRQFGAED
jgi:chaperone modulatory protein CbpM